MTIDEWIEKAKLNAKVNVEYPTDEILLQEAEEYAQLAEWLEELKELRAEKDKFERNISFFNEINVKIYNKAIDDVVEKIRSEWDMQDLYLPVHFIDLVEELKKGDKNE